MGLHKQDMMSENAGFVKRLSTNSQQQPETDDMIIDLMSKASSARTVLGEM